MVYTRGGSPLEYAIPRIAARGELHVLALQPMPIATEHLWREYCTSVIAMPDERLIDTEIVNVIVREATRLGVDGLITLSEFSVVSVAHAADQLGLRGAGRNAVRARDKRLMREIWEKAGVPIPRFRPVQSEAELRAAFCELTPPMLLKSAWGSGSVGQLVIDTKEAVHNVWAEATATVAAAHRSGFMDLQQPEAVGQFLVEEIIPGSINSWWHADSGYGDYLSVEGIVVDGAYHPLCITSRIPTIPPFTELSNLAPCALSEEKQRRIEAVATSAVNALELGTCGTHTELKLMEDGQVSVLETAARLGGVMVAPEIEHVYGYDPIGMLMDALLGVNVSFPTQMLTDADARGAAGSLSLIATDANGTSWSRHPVWDSSIVDWSELLSEGSTIELVPGLSIADGTPMPRYDNASGARGYGGIFFLRTADVTTLVRDSYAVLNGLEDALVQAWARVDSASGGTRL